MLICFCAHITFFSISFAKYETSTNYDAVESNKLDPPQLIICMPFEQFLNSENAITDTQHLLLGPSGHQFITDCSTLLDRNAYVAKCGEDFYKVTKFIKLEQICYSINITSKVRDIELLYSNKDPLIAQFELNLYLLDKDLKEF